MITRLLDHYNNLPTYLWATGVLLVGISPAIVGIAVMALIGHKV